MSRLKVIAHAELERLCVDVGSAWVERSTLTPDNVWPKTPGPAELETIARLTDRYRRVLEAFEAGNYLACVAIATTENPL